MSKEKEILDSIKLQLRNAIDDATEYLEEEDFWNCSDSEIYEGRLELAKELLEYLEEKIC